MITTPREILEQVSFDLREDSAETSQRRIGFFNVANSHICSEKKWRFKLKKATISAVDGMNSIDLTSSTYITDGDYDSDEGVYEVWVGNTRLEPIDYENKESSLVENSNYCYLSPDKKTLYFATEMDGDETIYVYYYAKPNNVSGADDTLNIPIPHSFKRLYCLYIEHLVHNSKRQRYDARNDILDYQEELSKLISKNARQKIKYLPKRIPNVYASLGLTRTY